VKRALNRHKSTLPNVVDILGESVQLNEDNFAPIKDSGVVSFIEKYMEKNATEEDIANAKLVFGSVFHVNSGFSEVYPKPPCGVGEYPILLRGLQNRVQLLKNETIGLYKRTGESVETRSAVEHTLRVIGVINAIHKNVQTNPDDCMNYDPQSEYMSVGLTGIDDDSVKDLFATFSYLVLQHLRPGEISDRHKEENRAVQIDPARFIQLLVANKADRDDVVSYAKELMDKNSGDSLPSVFAMILGLNINEMINQSNTDLLEKLAEAFEMTGNSVDDLIEKIKQRLEECEDYKTKASDKIMELKDGKTSAEEIAEVEGAELRAAGQEVARITEFNEIENSDLKNQKARLETIIVELTPRLEKAEADLEVKNREVAALEAALARAEMALETAIQEAINPAELETAQAALKEKQSTLKAAQDEAEAARLQVSKHSDDLEAKQRELAAAHSGAVVSVEAARTEERLKHASELEAYRAACKEAEIAEKDRTNAALAAMKASADQAAAEALAALKGEENRVAAAEAEKARIVAEATAAAAAAADEMRRKNSNSRRAQEDTQRAREAQAAAEAARQALEDANIVARDAADESRKQRIAAEAARDAAIAAAAVATSTASESIRQAEARTATALAAQAAAEGEKASAEALVETIRAELNSATIMTETAIGAASLAEEAAANANAARAEALAAAAAATVVTGKAKADLEAERLARISDVAKAERTAAASALSAAKQIKDAEIASAKHIRQLQASYASEKSELTKARIAAEEANSNLLKRNNDLANALRIENGLKETAAAARDVAEAAAVASEAKAVSLKAELFAKSQSSEVAYAAAKQARAALAEANTSFEASMRSALNTAAKIQADLDKAGANIQAIQMAKTALEQQKRAAEIATLEAKAEAAAASNRALAAMEQARRAAANTSAAVVDAVKKAEDDLKAKNDSALSLARARAASAKKGPVSGTAKPVEGYETYKNALLGNKKVLTDRWGVVSGGGDSKTDELEELVETLYEKVDDIRTAYIKTVKNLLETLKAKGYITERIELPLIPDPSREDLDEVLDAILRDLKYGELSETIRTLPPLTAALRKYEKVIGKPTNLESLIESLKENTSSIDGIHKKMKPYIERKKKRTPNPFIMDLLKNLP